MPTLEELHRRSYRRIWAAWVLVTTAAGVAAGLRELPTWVSVVGAWLGCVVSVRIGAKAQLVQLRRPRGAYIEKVTKSNG